MGKRPSKKSEFDQFFTRPEVARKCIQELHNVVNCDGKQFVEPSAGSGAFHNLIPGCFGMDIDPKHESIVKHDFLWYNDFSSARDKTVFIGNPPFGYSGTLAVKFFNHSALYGDTIAFILPRVFRKESKQKSLNVYFHKIHDIDIPKNGSFTFNGSDFNIVPCCFQVWVRKTEERKHEGHVTSDFFDFVEKCNANGDTFSIRRVGGNASKCYVNVAECSESSNYFIKPKNGLTKHDIMNAMKSIDFSDHVNSISAVKSLSKVELVKSLDKALIDRVR